MSHRPTRRTLVPPTLAATLAATLALALVAVGGGPAPAADPRERPAVATTRTTPGTGPGVPQTSDGVQGPLAAPITARQRRATTIDNESSYRVAPGIRFRRWDQTDARGQVRAYLLKANLAKPGVRLDYLGADDVQTREVPRAMVRADGAVAGVNGDFFDIDDTGAPLGLGVSGGRPIHGVAQELGWSVSFVQAQDGTASVGRVVTQSTLTARPNLRLSHTNSPHLFDGAIGLYTPEWGAVPGYRTVDGAAHRSVRQVVIRDGRVVSNSRTVTRSGDVRGYLLLGRGRGATALREQLPVGTRTGVTTVTEGTPRVGISGSAVLVDDGRVVVSDDGQLHPRTAVGYDTDTGRLLLLVVDGRQSFSRGYTLLELARMMRDLGADEALNLDGGGSSAMVARRESGRLGVLNSPSDGHQRAVPDGLALHYEAP